MTSPAPISWKRNLFVIAFSQFLAMAGFGCCMPFIPLLLKQNLNVDDEQMRGFLVSVYYLTGMVSLTIAYPIWGALSDKYGRKIMLLRASYCAGLIYPLLAFAPNFWVLMAIRFFVSLFSGTVNPAQTLLITTLPKEKHSMGLGYMSTAIWSGEMAGYLFGGVMVDHFGYTVAFLSCGAIYLFSGVMVHCLAQENFVRLSAEELAEKKAKKKKPKLKEILTPAVGWLLVLFLLMGIARRIETPYIAMLVEKINGEAKAATVTGITSAVASLGGILAGLCIGWLSAKFTPRRLLFPIVLVCMLFTAGQALATNIPFLQVSRFMTFCAAGCLQPVLQVLITQITPPSRHGAYLGWTASLNSAGGILCSFIGAPLAYLVGVRGIYFASAAIFLVMLPMLLPAGIAYKREKAAFDESHSGTEAKATR